MFLYSLYFLLFMVFALLGVLAIWFWNRVNSHVRQSSITKQEMASKAFIYIEPYLNYIISWRYIELLNSRFYLLNIKQSALNIYMVQIVLLLFGSVLLLFFTSGLLFFFALFSLWFALVFLLPIFYLNSLIAKKKENLLSAFSFFLDLLSLCLGSGASINQSLKVSSSFSRCPFLLENIHFLIDQLEQGVPSEQAWTKFSQRCDQEDVRAFVFAVLQAQKQGLSLTEVLQQQSQRIKTVLFTQAEKKALALPTKLIFPILVFIFPITFIVIAFPLVYGLLENWLYA